MSTRKTKTQMQTLAVAVAAMTVFLAAPLHAALQWTGDTTVNDDWFDGNNWSGSVVPGIADNVDLWNVGSPTNPIVINNSTLTAEANSIDMADSGQNAPAYLDVHTDLNVDERILIGWFNHDVRMRQFGGTVSAGSMDIAVNRTGNDRRYELHNAGSTLNIANDLKVGAGGPAKFVQNDGDVNVGGELWVHGEATNSYDMIAGSLDVASKMVVGWRTAGAFTHTGGQVRVEGDIQVDNNNHAVAVGGAEYVISDGAQLDANGSVILGNTRAEAPAIGTFRVNGSGDGTASIDVDGWIQQTAGDGNGTGQLTLQPDASGLIEINVDGNVTFSSDSMLEIDPLYTPTAGDSWLAMSWTGDLTQDGNGLVLTDDSAAGWDFELDEQAKTLTINYIPEPATIALLGLGGLMLVRRRK